MSEATDPPGRALHRIGIRSAQRVSRTQVAGRRCGVLPVLRLRLRAFSCDLRPSAGRQSQSGLETLEGAHVRLDGQLRGSWCAARTKSAPDDGACRCSQTGHAHGTDGQKPRPPAAALGSEITRARTVHAVLLLPSQMRVRTLDRPLSGFTVTRGGINARAGGRECHRRIGWHVAVRELELVYGQIKDLFCLDGDHHPAGKACLIVSEISSAMGTSRRVSVLFPRRIGVGAMCAACIWHPILLFPHSTL